MGQTFYQVTTDAPFWVGDEFATTRGVPAEQPHGVFEADTVVELLRNPTGMVLVTDGALTGWVDRQVLRAVPARPTPPRSALERLVGPDEPV